jgi:hypothetical protein
MLLINEWIIGTNCRLLLNDVHARPLAPTGGDALIMSRPGVALRRVPSELAHVCDECLDLLS